MKRTIAMCAAALLFVSGQALAAGQGQSSSGMGKSSSQSSQHMGSGTGSGSKAMSQNQFGTNRLSQLMDRDVKTANGEKIGEVSDVILDRNGNVSYLVVSHGGVLGMGDRLTPIPVSAFHKGNGQELTVNIDRNRLDNAPHFTSNQWPNFEDRTWDQQVRGYYGSAGSGSASGSGMSGSGSSGQSGSMRQGASGQGSGTGSSAGGSGSAGRSPSGNTGTSSGAAQ